MGKPQAGSSGASAQPASACLPATNKRSVNFQGWFQHYFHVLHSPLALQPAEGVSFLLTAPEERDGEDLAALGLLQGGESMSPLHSCQGHEEPGGGGSSVRGQEDSWGDSLQLLLSSATGYVAEDGSRPPHHPMVVHKG